ncbi:MAG TPA: glycine zipper 2TM domain-containing protein, partial [Usitatibacter sp.]|nr:glycine zipper 2TM domain-containing protein [Usitatibacter sp.]
QPNVGGAIVGGILGGILGHQVGGGHGRDVATAGGAVAGAVIGSQVGADGGARDVQRCETAYEGNPDYWDVTYVFRGVEHRVQMSAPPGPTIVVNEHGEPRG